MLEKRVTSVPALLVPMVAATEAVRKGAAPGDVVR